MATVGISASIDVSKIDKTKLIKGEKGTYLNITAFVNLDEKDQYDNNGMITQSVTADERIIIYSLHTLLLRNRNAFL